MPSSIDPAIVRALATSLKIDATSASLSSHGGSGFDFCGVQHCADAGGDAATQ